MDRNRPTIQFSFRGKATKPLYIGVFAWLLSVSPLTYAAAKCSGWSGFEIAAIASAQAAEAVKSDEAPETKIKDEAEKQVSSEDQEPVTEASNQKSAPRPGFFSGIVNTYVQAFQSIQAKVDELRRADEENGRLRLENAHLRLLVEAGRFERYAEHSDKMTRELERKLGEQTESRVGRTLASIAYHAPTDLPPKELYSLGLSYFRARDDEKAAVILTLLTGLEDDDRFRTSPNLILTGIAWYRIEHFEQAEHYFDEALKAARGKPDGESITRQGLLWKGLVAERIGKHEKSQAWLHEVLDRAPRSLEAALVNHGAEARQALPAKVVSKIKPEVAREPARARE